MVQLGHKLLIGTHWQTRLFVEEGENTKLALDEVNTRLVVGKVDKLPVNLLAHVLFLFELEDVGVKFLLQLLVGVVDTELLEGVLCKMFETIDIEYTDEGLGLRKDLIGSKTLVGALD